MPRAVACSIACLLSACTHEPTRPPPPPPSGIGRVALSSLSDTIRPADTITLSATVYDTAGQVLTGYPVTWLSERPERATVSEAGVVVGVGAGTTRIHATAVDKSAVADISVLPPLALAGFWDFVQTVTDPNIPAITCSDTGSFRLTQSGTTLEGHTDKVSSCVQRYGTGQVFGQIVGSRVWFRDPDCYYAATVEPISSTPVELTGWVDCGEAGFKPSGPFSAVIGKPVASIAVVPVSWKMVPTGVTQFSVVMRDSSGRRVFERPIHWSSDNQAVAQVDSAGVVMAASLGSASVMASLDGVPPSSTSVSVESVEFVSVSAGSGFSCGTTTSGSACWGGQYLALGNGLNQGSATPMPLADDPVLMTITTHAGASHACGLTSSGSASCWGHDLYGVLGDGNGTELDRNLPTRVAGGHLFAAIAAGFLHTCALDAAGNAWCWGSGNLLGQTTTPSFFVDTPLQVLGGLSFVSLAAGGEHTCGLTSGGQAYCWGLSNAFQLGVDTVPDYRPVAVSGGLTFVSLTLGRFHSCGLTSDSVAYCWGSNDYGQLGIGSQIRQSTPVAVSGGLRFTYLKAGWEYTCGLVASGETYCWGDSYPALLPLSDHALVPTRTHNDIPFVSLAPASAHMCGMTAAKVVYCWGFRLANGSSADSDTPIRVAGQP